MVWSILPAAVGSVLGAFFLVACRSGTSVAALT